MSPKLLSMEDCFSLKLALLTMQVPKFGKINLMITRVIYGLLVVFFTKCAVWCLLSEPLIWTCFIKKF
jgi:hypothetical protein